MGKTYFDRYKYYLGSVSAVIKMETHLAVDTEITRIDTMLQVANKPAVQYICVVFA